MYINNYKFLCQFLCFVFLLTACKKAVQVDLPVTELTSASVYTNDLKATAAMLGIYSRMAGSSFAPGAMQSISVVTALSADELQDYSFSTANTEFYLNGITPANGSNLAIWRTCYQLIYQANAVMEGLDGATGVSPAVKQQLRGEALFMRAFLHFYLVNLWGDVPFISTTDYRANASVARLPVAAVYQQIMADLTLASKLMKEEYMDADRSRPNKYAALALQARVQLFMGDWQKAAEAASAVIANGNYQLVADPALVFQRSSMETIWQLYPVFPNYNASEGYYYMLTDAPSYVALPASFVQSFEAGDLRREQWINSYTGNGQTFFFPYKYRVRYAADVTECSIVLRLAECYLIRAEARARLGMLTGNGSAAEDLDIVRSRASLPASNAQTLEEILLAIENERRFELFTEWGHRWLDLKRWKRADAVLGQAKAPHWQSRDTLYPVPLKELLNNQHLTQNNGY
ncbi:MAG TPA: RagB/SusD family nutrient uptake outer membrane protein [Chitinophagaceae bacterium]|nr:RagB/SusD family nutrient uptake outer membrane protein [Chitinophagaceae bacterium]